MPQVTDVTSADFRCYTSQTQATASTIQVQAGSQMGVGADQAMYHPGVINVYMAKAPGNVTTWDGSGTVWFKVRRGDEPAKYLLSNMIVIRSTKLLLSQTAALQSPGPLRVCL